MSSFASPSEYSSRPDNVSSTERWLSAFAGLGLLLSATRARNVAGQAALGIAGLSLLTRGAAGYCAMKGVVQGQSSFTEGLNEQWRRLTQEAGDAARRLHLGAATRIDSMDALFTAELQELQSAESQLIALARELVRVLGSAPLAFRIEEYATELQARKTDLDGLLERLGADRRDHPDDAMYALIEETHKMAGIEAENLRDAAVAASVQRIIHYKIAGYGTIAAYAKALGRLTEAGQFAQYAERDKTIDAEITEIAKDILNPEAVISPQETPTSEMRTH
jgi:ferritin-like metal-binding protein YciE